MLFIVLNEIKNVQWSYQDVPAVSDHCDCIDRQHAFLILLKTSSRSLTMALTMTLSSHKHMHTDTL
jgi:hypothetical protein